MKRLLAGTLLAVFGSMAMAIEEPGYDTVLADDPYEVRQYRPMIVAETVVAGDLSGASNAGFRLIADFIFGNNTSPRGQREKIEMTAPVMAEPASEKIEMTAPVTVEPASEKIEMTAPVSVADAGGLWRVHFVMPSKYTLETLPRPNNPAVRIRELPPARVAVVTFSGLAGERKVAEKTDDLLRWIRSRGFTAAGKPQLARYNPPWTLPFLRRNEVQVELK
jgi:hypothetical protein